MQYKANSQELNTTGETFLHFSVCFNDIHTDVSEKSVKIAGNKQPVTTTAALLPQISAPCHL